MISIHAPHTGRDFANRIHNTYDFLISIHAPHTGRDVRSGYIIVDIDISIHAPHTGRDVFHARDLRPDGVFQSTRPIRGATCWTWWTSPPGKEISIHAPHTGRDSRDDSPYERTEKFQSTRPIRGATGGARRTRTRRTDFNPRAPYGARRKDRRPPAGRLDFNPRAPYGARLDFLGTVLDFIISIHAPHTGRDFAFAYTVNTDNAISIHAPHTGRDAKCMYTIVGVQIFQSTRPIRGATFTAAAGVSP